MIDGPNDGVYQLAFTGQQLLTAEDGRPGAPLLLLPPGQGAEQRWQVESAGGGYTIRTTKAPLYVGFDGDPDMHETALLLPEPRIWNLVPGEDGDTYSVAVPNTDMRLGMSLLRIYPPRIALAPDYGDRYQAWTFQKAG